MSMIIYLTVLLVLFKFVQPLNILPDKKNSNLTGRRKILIDMLVHNLSNTRRNGLNPMALAKAKEMFKKITKNLAPGDLQKLLRNSETEPNVEINDEHANLVEIELKDSLANKQSALLQRPYVEKKGINDFLVMRPAPVDPFVTVIPNAIYYNTELKCVNWLDDCSINGIRGRLLKGVNSPYK